MLVEAIGRSPTLRGRARMAIMKVVMGTVPDVVKTLEVRPEIFGRFFHAGLQALMRRSQEWKPVEAEILATEVSKANTCDFCAGIHGQVTAGLFGGTYGDALAMRAHDPRLEAAIALAQKLTKTPQAIGAADIAHARSSGLSDRAIEEVAYLAAFFCTINRTANALHFEMLQGRSLRWAGRALRWLGYYDV
jgi:uncharacterized peroxidase-related enzyme